MDTFFSLNLTFIFMFLFIIYEGLSEIRQQKQKAKSRKLYQHEQEIVLFNLTLLVHTFSVLLYEQTKNLWFRGG